MPLPGVEAAICRMVSLVKEWEYASGSSRTTGSEFTDRRSFLGVQHDSHASLKRMFDLMQGQEMDEPGELIGDYCDRSPLQNVRPSFRRSPLWSSCTLARVVWMSRNMRSRCRPGTAGMANVVRFDGLDISFTTAASADCPCREVKLFTTLPPYQVDTTR